MSILLNSKELEAVLDNWGKAPAGREYDAMVAKAQLKKIVEYLRPHVYIRTDAPYKSTIDPDAWQVLLKEAGL